MNEKIIHYSEKLQKELQKIKQRLKIDDLLLKVEQDVEVQKIRVLIDEKIQTLIQRKEVDKLKFLFYECFGKENGDLNDIYVQLKKEIKDGTKNCQKISDFFKLISLK